jgi:hypothetical protein
MNQPPGYPPGGPPQYPGQPGFPPQGQPQQPQAKPFQGTQLMPGAPAMPQQAPQQPQYGQPPAPQPYGAPPPQAPPGYGQPPPGQPAYGQPPPGQQPFGQPPPGQPAYGQPPPGGQPGYGAPPGQPYGAPPQGPAGYGLPPTPPGYGPPPGAAPYGAPQPGYGAAPNPYAAPQGFGAPGGLALQPGAGKPQVRNAVMTFLLPAIISVGAVIVGVILMVIGGIAESAILALFGTLVYALGALAGSVIGFISAIKMLGELNRVTNSGVVQWWMLLVPFWGVYVAWIVVPAEVAKAKQMVNAQQPPRGIVVYIFLWLYALAADLNDIAQAMPQ